MPIIKYLVFTVLFRDRDWFFPLIFFFRSLAISHPSVAGTHSKRCCGTFALVMQCRPWDGCFFLAEDLVSSSVADLKLAGEVISVL